MIRHIGFTGTRHGMTVAQRAEVASLVATFARSPPAEADVEFYPRLVCHHGDCIGADSEFHDIARSVDALIEIHPGPLHDHQRQAGRWGHVRHPALPHMRRNKIIVLESEVMIATPFEAEEQLRGGTWSTIRMARAAKRPLAIVWPNGTHNKERWL